MLEDSVLERDNLAPHELESGELESQELESPGSVPAFARERDLQPGTKEAIPRCRTKGSPSQPSSPGVASCVAAPLSPRSERCCSLLF